MKTWFPPMFIAIASYWLGYNAAMFNVEMGAKNNCMFSPYTRVEIEQELERVDGIFYTKSPERER